MSNAQLHALHDDVVVRFRDACREAGISPSTMRRRMDAGDGPKFIKLSARCLGVRRGDLRQWLASRQPGHVAI
ncbi:helix-turn-helix transcriptional regulator [Methylobacterium sp. ID0610]|uniref:helix-turn-helix transcriptional regulator n=1 Tax=Methylobacterium carpenticola TaxID=3344827 RepID=UPI0036C7A626